MCILPIDTVHAYSFANVFTNLCNYTGDIQPGRLANSNLYISLFVLLVITITTCLQSSYLWRQSSVFTESRSELVVDPISNISVHIEGQCRQPIVYVGVDTRRHLLHHYDLYAVPTEKYSPPKMNWARIAVIRFALQHCDQSSWVVYSDTDAYIHSTTMLETRLHENVPSGMHVVYQHGMWSLNSGFHAWRMSNVSRNIAKQWNELYKPSNNFFAEQRALLVVCEHRHPGETTGRPNGFLGWHIKGSARHKTEIASLGRFACWYESVIRHTLWAIVAIVFVAYLSRAETAKKMAGGLFNFVTDFRVVIAFILLWLPLCVFTASFSRKAYDAISQSKKNFNHLLPGGRAMIGNEYLCNNAYYCVKRNWQHAFWEGVSHMPKQAVLFLFVIVDVVEKSTLLYIYPVLVCSRAMYWLRCYIYRAKPAVPETT